jgi:microcystin-dependent protein
MDPFIGQIMMFGGNFPPRGWAFCDGQLLAINSNSALFSILGTTYGGDGRTTFALPDLRGRIAMHPGNGPGLSPKRLGQKRGRETVTLQANQLPPHSHDQGNLTGAIMVNEEDGDSDEPAGKSFGNASAGTPYNSNTNDKEMASAVAIKGNTGSSGSGQYINIENPYSCVNYIIALQGTFPSRS